MKYQIFFIILSFCHKSFVIDKYKPRLNRSEVKDERKTFLNAKKGSLGVHKKNSYKITINILSDIKISSSKNKKNFFLKKPTKVRISIVCDKKNESNSVNCNEIKEFGFIKYIEILDYEETLKNELAVAKKDLNDYMEKVKNDRIKYYQSWVKNYSTNAYLNEYIILKEKLKEIESKLENYYIKHNKYNHD